MSITLLSFLKRAIYFLSIVVLMALGLACFLLPFLPFGWILCVIAILLILPYFQSGNEPKKQPKWLNKLKEKDKKGWLKKGKVIVQRFYRWAHSTH